MFHPMVGMKQIRGTASVLGRVWKSGFFRNVFIVMSGTGLAQAITFAVSPVVSRLFSPADFGVFGTYICVAGVLGFAATLNYADALVIPRREAEAAPMFLFACLATSVIAVASGVFCWLAPAEWLKCFGIGDLGSGLWATLPILVLLLGWGQCLSAWCTRLKAFKTSSESQVVRAITVCTVQVGAGLIGLGGAGLIWAALIGEISPTMFLGRAVLRRNEVVFRESAQWPLLYQRAWEYKEFALYGCPQIVLNAVSQGIPVLLLAHYFGVVVAGSYAFGIRLVQAPANLVLTSIRQVLYQKLCQVGASRELCVAFIKSTGLLAAFSFVLSCFGFAAAPSGFAFVFGEQWREAGHYARWLIIWVSFATFCNVPSILSARILRLQRDLFLFDLIVFLARTATLILGGIYLTSLHTVMGISIVSALLTLLFVVYVGIRLRRLYLSCGLQVREDVTKWANAPAVVE